MSLDSLLGVLRRFDAYATTEHALPPFCVVYMWRGGDMVRLQSAVTEAGYAFALWQSPEFYREILVDTPVSQPQQPSQLWVPGKERPPYELERWCVLNQKAAFVINPDPHLWPDNYCLLTPNISAEQEAQLYGRPEPVILSPAERSSSSPLL